MLQNDSKSEQLKSDLTVCIENLLGHQTSNTKPLSCDQITAWLLMIDVFLDLHIKLGKLRGKSLMVNSLLYGVEREDSPAARKGWSSCLFMSALFWRDDGLHGQMGIKKV